MTVLIVLEGFVILLLGLLVAGLLRSHAEILRKLHDLGVHMNGEDDHSVPLLQVAESVTPPRQADTPAHDLAGMAVNDDALAIRVTGTGQTTLLAFLSSGCSTCAGFWEAFGNGARDALGHTRLVIVTKSPEDESKSTINKVAPSRVPVLMSSQAWLDYEVPGSPYFVLVDGTADRIVGEGSAGDWEQLNGLIAQAIGDAPAPPRGRSDADRADRIDAELTAAGIYPGHPSLYGKAED